MNKQQFEALQESLRIVRAYLKADVASQESTGEKLNDMEIFLKNSIDESKLKEV